MFDRIHDFIRALFSDHANSSERSPARAALAKTFKDLEAAEEEVKDREGVIANLKRTIEAGAAHVREFELITSPSGAAGYAAFALGEKSPMAEHAGKVEHAAQAADHARRALPIAERALANASAEVVQLRERKSQQISSIKIEHGDVLARRYDAKRRELSEIHDQVIGFARGCNLPNIVLTTKPYESLASTPSDTTATSTTDVHATSPITTR